MVDLACDMKSYDYVHSDDPVDGRDAAGAGGTGIVWPSGFARAACARARSPV
jgi:hypothetical protein